MEYKDYNIELVVNGETIDEINCESESEKDAIQTFLKDLNNKYDV